MIHYRILWEKNVLFSLQLEFQQRYSTTHALIHLTDKIRNETDNYGCGIFVNFWRTFSMVDHHILLKKLEQYGIRRNWNLLLITTTDKFVLITGINSNQADVKCEVCVKALYWDLFHSLFILMTYIWQSKILRCTTLQIILT